MTGHERDSVYSGRLAPGHSGNLLTCPACRPLWLVLAALVAVLVLAAIP